MVAGWIKSFNSYDSRGSFLTQVQRFSTSFVDLSDELWDLIKDIWSGKIGYGSRMDKDNRGFIGTVMLNK
jgi:hypothetical protein